MELINTHSFKYASTIKSAIKKLDFEKPIENLEIITLKELYKKIFDILNLKLDYQFALVNEDTIIKYLRQFYIDIYYYYNNSRSYPEYYTFWSDQHQRLIENAIDFIAQFDPKIFMSMRESEEKIIHSLIIHILILADPALNIFKPIFISTKSKLYYLFARDFEVVKSRSNIEGYINSFIQKYLKQLWNYFINQEHYLTLFKTIAKPNYLMIIEKFSKFDDFYFRFNYADYISDFQNRLTQSIEDNKLLLKELYESDFFDINNTEQILSSIYSTFYLTIEFSFDEMNFQSRVEKSIIYLRGNKINELFLQKIKSKFKDKYFYYASSKNISIQIANIDYGYRELERVLTFNDLYKSYFTLFKILMQNETNKLEFRIIEI